MQAVDSGSFSFMMYAIVNTACDTVEFTQSFPFVLLRQEGPKGSAWDAFATSGHRHPLAG